MFIWTTEIACVCFMVVIQKLKKVRSFLKLLKFFLKDGKAIDNSKVPGKEPGTHITSMPASPFLPPSCPTIHLSLHACHLSEDQGCLF